MLNRDYNWTWWKSTKLAKNLAYVSKTCHNRPLSILAIVGR